MFEQERHSRHCDRYSCFGTLRAAYHADPHPRRTACQVDSDLGEEHTQIKDQVIEVMPEHRFEEMGSVADTVDNHIHAASESDSKKGDEWTNQGQNGECGNT